MLGTILGLIAGVAATLAALVVLFPDKFFKAVFGSRGGRAPRQRQPPLEGMVARVVPHYEDVTVSAFATSEVNAGDTALIQAVVHLTSESSETLEAFAKQFDRSAVGYGSSSLAAQIALGDRIVITLTAFGAANVEIPNGSQEVVWHGQTMSVGFPVCLSPQFEGKHLALCLGVERFGIPIGRLMFVMPVGERTKHHGKSLVGQIEPYRSVFVSYSSDDRPLVDAKLDLLRAMNVRLFFDSETLRAGDDWERKLTESLAECDLFLLFWSHRSASSKWVQREVELAVARHNASDLRVPDIKPYHVDPPPRATKPDVLRPFHFGALNEARNAG
jgi:hypothetical protein